MKTIFYAGLCVALCFSSNIYSQVNFTANDFGAVPAYNGYFMYGTNLGWYGGSWDDKSLADIAAGNPSKNVAGAGIKTLRILLPEDFLENWGYDARISEFAHYTSLGMREHTVFVGFPSGPHKDPSTYGGCGEASKMFRNMYEPIWDGGANGTPVNDNNYYALYLYKTVTRYKTNTRFWEIMNEPDYDGGGNGWKLPGQAGNWWDNNPTPCELANMKAPVFHYIRMLRISYEIIKTLDPSAYVAVGGLGYASFLDAVLRNTDNPADGSVTAEYPLRGGAYFDVLSFHNYPMYNLAVWDNSLNDFVQHRHSDAAAAAYINAKNSFVTVLNSRGYNNTTYPSKHYISTENNIPRKEFGNYIGTDEAQRNYIIKVLVANQQNAISQYYNFVLGDSKTYAEATDPYQLMGMYQKLEGVGPFGSSGIYGQQYNNEGIAHKTCSDLLRFYRYDTALSAALNLPASVGGGAFRDSIGNTVFVLWAKTTIDKSEVAAAAYSFPTNLGIAPLLYKRDWNYSVTGSTSSIPSIDIALTASPIFLSPNFQIVPLRDRVTPLPPAAKVFAVSVFPNPAQQFANIRFTLESPARVQVQVVDAAGHAVMPALPSRNYATGTHIIPLAGIEKLSSGVYFCRIRTDEVLTIQKLVIVR